MSPYFSTQTGSEALLLVLQGKNIYGEHANIHQSHSQNDSGDLRGVAGGDGELGCLCGKAGTSHLCDGSAHSSGCVVNGSNAIHKSNAWVFPIF